MRYVVRKSIVQIVGKIWQLHPSGMVCAQTLEMSDYDLRNATDDEGNITRNSLLSWLDTHAGDFASIDETRDFLLDNHYACVVYLRVTLVTSNGESIDEA